MNKAFMREPDNVLEHCPRCGSLGVGVGGATLDALVRPEARAHLAETAAFCPYAPCEVAYFDVFERVATVDQLVRPVYPKDPDAPICPCFGLTVDDIEQDVGEGRVARVRSTVERARSPEARCVTHSATGRACIPAVQKYYLQAVQKK